MPEDTRIVVEAYDGEVIDGLARGRKRPVRDSRLVAALGDTDPESWQVLGRDVPVRKRERHRPVVATFFDPVREPRPPGDRPARFRRGRGRLGIGLRPSPSPDERRTAADLLRADDEFCQVARPSTSPCPPLSDVEFDDGTSTGRIGLTSPTSAAPLERECGA